MVGFLDVEPVSPDLGPQTEVPVIFRRDLAYAMLSVKVRSSLSQGLPWLCLHCASQLEHLGIELDMQCLPRSKIFHREVVTLLHSLFPGEKKYIVVVED